MNWKLYSDDCLLVLPQLERTSFDACVTDPPYGLSFMGKGWDHGVPGVAYWREVYRVLKPGAYLLAFGGTRTYHRLACAIEDAGFEMRDMVSWVYGSGFPKSHNVGNGFGTALKPALEPICMARKPLSAKTVAANVLAWGTGAINVDGCRIAGEVPSVPQPSLKAGNKVERGLGSSNGRNGEMSSAPAGRWPANVILSDDEEVTAAFPETGAANVRVSEDKDVVQSTWTLGRTGTTPRGISDAGGSAARFFYQAKQDIHCGLCGLPYTTELCNANFAENDLTTASIQNENSVHSDVLDSQALRSEDKSTRLSDHAINVENGSRECPPQSGNFVRGNVQDWPLSRIVQNVRSAADLCSLCATDIARALVALKTHQSVEEVLSRASMREHKKRILCQHLALYVAGRENTDIITTIPSLQILLGSVFHAIANITNSGKKRKSGEYKFRPVKAPIFK